MELPPIQVKLKKKPKAFPFDAIPWIDTLLICILLTTTSSQFVNAPGLPINLPQAASSTLSSQPTSAVITLYNDNLFFFQGFAYQKNDLQDAFYQHTQSPNNSSPSLLVKMDKASSLEGLLHICDIAKKSGFANIHIAATPNKPSSP